MYIYCMYIYIYLFLTAIAIGLTPGGSSTVHIFTQTIHRIQKTEHNNKKGLWKCEPCPVFASCTLALLHYAYIIEC
jgi:hypothetical protein